MNNCINIVSDEPFSAVVRSGLAVVSARLDYILCDEAPIPQLNSRQWNVRHVTSFLS